MQRYLNIDGDSNVYAYELGDDQIAVQFRDGTVYTYTYASAGRDNVEQMKSLAAAGTGLNSFIRSNPRVRMGYASKR